MSSILEVTKTSFGRFFIGWFKWHAKAVKQDANGWKNNMNDQKKECGCVSNDLLLKLIEQNNQLINQVAQVIQINNEQNAQINELLIQLTEDDNEPKRLGYLDD